MRFFFLLFSFLLITDFFWAQVAPPVKDTVKNPIDSTISVPDEFSNSLESLASDWLMRTIDTRECDSVSFPTNIPDSIIKLRLSKMHCVMEMPYNDYIRSFVDLYTVRKRKQLGYMLGMKDYYFPIFERNLEAGKLPLELKYLPVIESALRPTALSRVGAAGLWQFMISTGRMYGLEINSLIDERLDPIKSTHAAVKFLSDLYSIYGDWNLVIAAYNCGPGNVNKAIKRAGGSKDYWTIYPYLPKETRGYVPIFIAANYAMHYAEDHGVCKLEPEIPLAVDTIVVNRRIHLEQVAGVLDIPVDVLQLLNPQYKRKVVPGDIKPYSIALPMKKSGDFITLIDSIVGFKRDSLITERRTEIDLARKDFSSSSSGKVIYHKVRSGQNLGVIAKKYGVTVSNLKKWNNLSNSMIRIGQRLKIYK